MKKIDNTRLALDEKLRMQKTLTTNTEAMTMLNFNSNYCDLSKSNKEYRLCLCLPWREVHLYHRRIEKVDRCRLYLQTKKMKTKISN